MLIPFITSSHDMINFDRCWGEEVTLVTSKEFIITYTYDYNDDNDIYERRLIHIQ